MPYDNKHLLLDENTLSFLRRIKADREKQGLSLRKLTRLLGLKDHNNIYLYEHGKVAPSLGTFLKLAEFFGWDISKNPNYIFYSGFFNPDELKKIRKHFSFTNKELAHIIGVNEMTISYLFAKPELATIKTVNKILEIFADEERREKIRDEILAQPHRKKERR